MKQHLLAIALMASSLYSAVAAPGDFGEVEKHTDAVILPRGDTGSWPGRD